MMSTLLVIIGLVLAGVYLLVGLIFVVPFLTYGIIKIDESTHGSGVGFKIIISPGIIVLWPILLRKWIVARKFEDVKSEQKI